MPLARRLRIDLEAGAAWPEVDLEGRLRPHVVVGISHAFAVGLRTLDIPRRPGACSEPGASSSCTPGPTDPGGLSTAPDRAGDGFLDDPRATYGSLYRDLRNDLVPGRPDLDGDEPTYELDCDGRMVGIVTGEWASVSGTASATFRWDGCDGRLFDLDHGGSHVGKQAAVAACRTASATSSRGACDPCAMPFSRSAFLSGLRDVAPMMLGVAPFGMITGVAAVEIGLRPLQAVGMSVLVFAGASQLAGIALLGQGAAFLVVVATVFVINLRHTMYSASLAPWLRSLRPVTRLGLSYLMTDHAYAFSILRFRREPSTLARRDYYLGVAFPLWLVWVAATAAGAALSARVPASWQLDFAIPLTFIALLVPAVRDRPSALAALVAAGVAVLTRNLPYNAGLMLASAAGLVAGTTSESRWLRRPWGGPMAADTEGDREDAA